MRIDTTGLGSYAGGATAPATFSSEDFMALLLAQLRQQDPLDPMQPREFVSQLAQLQSVAELASLRRDLGTWLEGQAALAPLALLGREVAWRDAEGTWRAGVVSELLRDAGRLYLAVGEELLAWEQVARVR